MAQDRAQSLLLPQPGYILPQPGLGAVPSVARGFRDPTTNFSYSKLTPIVLPPGTYFDQRQSSFPPGPLPLRPISTGTVPTEAPEQDYQIITYEDLEKLLPKPKPTGRIEVGLLPDGSAYAPKTGENYLLFPSKSSYILYFTHHYFSRENLSRDWPLLSRMVNRLILPLDQLVKAPRLVALNTTQEEVEQALVKSKVVCLEDIGNGVRGVRRIDGFPAIGAPNDTGSARSPVVPISDSVTNSTMGTGVGSNQSYASPTFTSTQSTDGSNDDERLMVTSLADLSFTTKSSTPGYSFLSSDQSGQGNALISPTSGPSGNRLSPNPPISSSANQSAMYFTVVSGPSTTAYDGTTTSLAVSNGSVSLSRPNSTIWSPSSTYTLSPNNRQSMHGGNASQQQQQQQQLDSPSVTHNNHSSSILGLPSRPPYGQSTSFQPSELQPISLLQMRQQNAVPQYLLGQTAHGSGAYPGSLSFCQMSPNNSPMNLAVAAAMANPVHQQLSPNPQFANQMFSGQPGQMSSMNAHQANVALAAANSYQAAVAALAAVAQQPVAPAYFNASITPNMHSQMHVPSAVQSPLPIYYTAQPLTLPAHFQRHSLPRFPHGSVYPVQAYYQTNPATARHATGQPPSDLSGQLNKEGTVYPTMTGGPQVATTIAYPFLFQPHVPMHHTNQAPMHNPNLVAAAAAGLHIQYPQQTSRQPQGNTFNLTPLGLTMVNSPASAPSQTQVVSKDSVNPSTSTDILDKVPPSTETTPDDQLNDATALIYSTSPVTGTKTISASSTSSSDNAVEPVSQHTSVTGECVILTEVSRQTKIAVDKSESPDDSEDSASSGIGEMNSAGSSGPTDTRTSSSLTLTDQPLVVDPVSSTAGEFVSYRRHPRSIRTKDAERNP